MKTISSERHQRMLENLCNKGKHKIKTNSFGVSFCVICGLLSNKEHESLEEDHKLLIVKN